MKQKKSKASNEKPATSPAKNDGAASSKPAAASNSGASPRSTAPAKAAAGRDWLWLVGPLLAVLLLWGLWQQFGQPASDPASTPPAPATVSTVVPITTTRPLTGTTGTIGGVASCRRQPGFTNALGVSTQSFLSTRDRKIKGLAVIDPTQPAGSFYQHPSWQSAGYLGPFVLDRNGNIYVVPSPRISVMDNPPALQNRLYKVDSTNQEMSLYLELPSDRQPSLINPYGAMGLAYDCETESLYVSSVAGSDRDQEVGQIYRIDLATGQVVAQIANLDAIGLVIFNGAGGKRLYFGSARQPQVNSVALDGQGNFVEGTPRSEFSLADVSARGYNRARRINITPTGEMLVYTMKFNYNLSPSDDTQVATLQYLYDAASDSWTRNQVQQSGEAAS